MSDLRVTIPDCDEQDTAALVAYLAEQGLMASFEQSTRRSRTGWAPLLFEPGEDE